MNSVHFPRIIGRRRTSWRYVIEFICLI
ncbi:hypothetical protein CFP56_028492 [Quercus suber]|uniref:Uncharacterized protein n=1 Tax=Quercus suber TaxID=58331 RepID=A0AAW0JVH8_QUESU